MVSNCVHFVKEEIQKVAALAQVAVTEVLFSLFGLCILFVRSPFSLIYVLVVFVLSIKITN